MSYSPRQANYVIFFHRLCPGESRVLSNNNTPKYMIKLFLDSVTNSVNVELENT